MRDVRQKDLRRRGCAHARRRLPDLRELPLLLRAAAGAAGRPVPARLSETGLYTDVGADTLAPGVMPYRPAFELWSDGASKRRWIALPPGTRIDTSDMDSWQFPVGTKLWKELARDGIRIETRLLQRTGPRQGDWATMAYLWNDTNTEATAVPDGIEDARGTSHDIPAANECNGCHGGRPSRVLGFSAIQLSGDELPGMLALDELVKRDLLTAPPAGRLELHAEPDCARGARLPPRELRPLPQPAASPARRPALLRSRERARLPVARGRARRRHPDRRVPDRAGRGDQARRSRRQRGREAHERPQPFSAQHAPAGQRADRRAGSWPWCRHGSEGCVDRAVAGRAARRAAGARVARACARLARAEPARPPERARVSLGSRIGVAKSPFPSADAREISGLLTSLLLEAEAQVGSALAVRLRLPLVLAGVDQPAGGARSDIAWGHPEAALLGACARLRRRRCWGAWRSPSRCPAVTPRWPGVPSTTRRWCSRAPSAASRPGAICPGPRGADTIRAHRREPRPGRRCSAS